MLPLTFIAATALENRELTRLNVPLSVRTKNGLPNDT